MSATFAFLHHLAAFVLFASLAVELVLVKTPLTLVSARKILLADLIYGISASVILIVGGLRVMFFEKGPDYYMHNHAFMAKMGLFIFIGLVSIYPTVKLMAWRPALRAGKLPDVTPRQLRTIGRVIHGELTGLVLMILCAAMMARGIGMPG